MLEVFQSGFKTLHSAESALFRVFHDILFACDSGDHVILAVSSAAPSGTGLGPPCQTGPLV